MRWAVVDAIVQTNITYFKVPYVCSLEWLLHIRVSLSKTVNPKSLPEGVPLLSVSTVCKCGLVEPIEWSRISRYVTDAHSSPPLTQLNNGAGAEAGSDSDFYKPKRKYNGLFRNTGNI